MRQPLNLYLCSQFALKEELSAWLSASLCFSFLGQFEHAFWALWSEPACFIGMGFGTKKCVSHFWASSCMLSSLEVSPHAPLECALAPRNVGPDGTEFDDYWAKITCCWF